MQWSISLVYQLPTGIPLSRRFFFLFHSGLALLHSSLLTSPNSPPCWGHWTRNPSIDTILSPFQIWLIFLFMLLLVPELPLHPSEVSICQVLPAQCSGFLHRFLSCALGLTWTPSGFILQWLATPSVCDLDLTVFPHLH